MINAYLSSVIDDYLSNIAPRLSEGSLHVMTSAGGLVGARDFRPKDSLLSGPAGGVVGAAAIGKMSGFDHLISFDMGGTSTDVARYDAEFEYKYELEVGDARIFSPALSIETVAAGGGSICGFDGFKLFVGPESAGAFPGPACYGAGGPLTITDVNLLAGRLDIQQFGIPVQLSEAEERMDQLLKRIAEQTGQTRSKEEVLEGFLGIANEIMASAIKKISVAKGYDPAQYALVAFGGAGGLHACAIARLLNIPTILVPRDAGLLSAFGLSSAVIERFAEKQMLAPLSEVEGQLPELFAQLAEQAIEQVQQEGVDAEEVEVRTQTVHLRFKGQDASLDAPYLDDGRTLERFREKYEGVYGHWVDNREVEVESLRAIASSRTKSPPLTPPEAAAYEPEPAHYLEAYDGGQWRRSPVFVRDQLTNGACIRGFALLLDKHSTTVIERGWRLRIDAAASAVLEQVPSTSSGQVATENEAAGEASTDAATSQEAELELFTNRFMGIAENMGAMLQRTALSVNVKERLDFSCALLDADGFLVANAPHIPVHLGSLGVCVRGLIEHLPLNAGDTVVTNHPGFGGSHLPDITLVTPVYEDGTRIGFVVNRAHHAEMGGTQPASMPSDAVCLMEEGVVIAPYYLAKGGAVDWAGVRAILQGATFPSRAVEENLADLNAALAANMSGEAALKTLVRQHGAEKVRGYMRRLKEYAADKMAETLSRFPDGVYRAEERLDDGAPLCVCVTVEGSKCQIDFTGSAGVHPGNLNCNLAVVNSVVIYVLRLLLQEAIPLNDGIFGPVRLTVPKGMLNPDFPDDPRHCPAVVGGNIETSQRLTDTLLKAFGVVACSQGTMNNLLFGNERFSYYETIGGGCGAGEDFVGASAVHHHMTNTRITDPEILEHRCPVRVEQFGIRLNSSGAGRRRGGDGIVRELVFLEPVSLSLLCQHRQEAPYGLHDGAPGKRGEQYVRKADGELVELGGMDGAQLQAGDRLIIKTPGGGGCGAPESGAVE